MESPICFRIPINRNFGDLEIQISKCNRTLEQPGHTHIKIMYVCVCACVCARVCACVCKRNLEVYAKTAEHRTARQGSLSCVLLPGHCFDTCTIYGACWRVIGGSGGR